MFRQVTFLYKYHGRNEKRNHWTRKISIRHSKQNNDFPKENLKRIITNTMTTIEHMIKKTIVKSMTLGVSRARRAARAPGPLRRAPLPSDPQKHRFRKVVLYSHESSGKIRYGQARYRTKIVSFGGCNWARNRFKEQQCKTSSYIFWRDRFWGLRQTHA